MSVYRVTELIGTSPTSREDAATEAVRRAQQTIDDIRVAEVLEQDMAMDETGGDHLLDKASDFVQDTATKDVVKRLLAGGEGLELAAQVIGNAAIVG